MTPPCFMFFRKLSMMSGDTFAPLCELGVTMCRSCAPIPHGMTVASNRLGVAVMVVLCT